MREEKELNEIDSWYTKNNLKGARKSSLGMSSLSMILTSLVTN
jgi:hypothetical protein